MSTEYSNKHGTHEKRMELRREDDRDIYGFCKAHSGVIVRIRHIEDKQEGIEGKLDKIHSKVTGFLVSALLIFVTQVLLIIYKETSWWH